VVVPTFRDCRTKPSTSNFPLVPVHVTCAIPSMVSSLAPEDASTAEGKRALLEASTMMLHGSEIRCRTDAPADNVDADAVVCARIPPDTRLRGSALKVEKAKAAAR
ncbi:MAG: hypothetical protein ACKOAG_11275, partial [Candidatus Kapaibacterium sp.]